MAAAAVLLGILVALHQGCAQVDNSLNQTEPSATRSDLLPPLPPLGIAPLSLRQPLPTPLILRNNTNNIQQPPAPPVAPNNFQNSIPHNPPLVVNTIPHGNSHAIPHPQSIPPAQLIPHNGAQGDVIRPNEFCNPMAPPTCLDGRFGFCLSDDEYPEDEIKVAMELFSFTEQINLRPQRDDRFHLAANAETQSTCLATTLWVKPIRARNIDGNWRVIVQDAHDVIQRERVVSCLTPDATCYVQQYFNPVYCHNSRCSQQFHVRKLLAFDPCNPVRGVFIDSFKMPSACSCRLSRMPC